MQKKREKRAVEAEIVASDTECTGLMPVFEEGEKAQERLELYGAMHPSEEQNP